MKTWAIFFYIMVATSSANAATPEKNPFFLVGDGHLKIHNKNNGHTVDVTYLNPDGSLNESAFIQIDSVFGFPTQVLGENISRRTIGFLDYFTDQFNKNAIIELASGYRSQDYNNALRKRGATAAKTSTHIDGMAIDFSIPGVAGKTLWETIRAKNCCGTGYYYGNVVHLDSGRPRFWTTDTSQVHTGASDFNRYIYASTEYDRYAAGDVARILFTSVSDFGFGVKSDVTIVKNTDGTDKVATAKISLRPDLVQPNDKNTTCITIKERKQARFLYFTLPENLKPGTYSVHINFCNKTAPLMPDSVVTNQIEIIRD